MAKKIALLNFKGGVGKTTTTVNLGKALHLLKKKVLLIDLDSQMNTSGIMGYNKGDGDTIYEAMISKVATPLPVYEHEIEEGVIDTGFDFVPASVMLADIGEVLMGRVRREDILKNLLAPYEDEYDYILMDCPPNRGIITVNAMCASDSLIVPLDSEVLSLEGMGEITAKFEEIRSTVNNSLDIMGYLMTKYNGRLRLHQTVAETMEGTYQDKVFKTRIRLNVALGEMPASRQNIFEYSPESYGAKDYMRLAEEITGLKFKRKK